MIEEFNNIIFLNDQGDRDKIVKKYLENLNEEIYDYDPPYDIDTKKYTIDTIEYYKISDIVKDDICNELISINRYGKCHKGAIMLLSLDDSNILSGYVNSNGKLYFHSIVEIGDYIMDYTKNLFIKKEDYFRLTSFKLIQKITREDYFKDMNILSDFTGIDLRIYLAFRDELIKELNNKKLTLKD